VETPKNPWIWGFLIVGLICIGLSLFLTTNPNEHLATTPPLAKAQRITGDATITRHGSLKREKLEGHPTLSHLDSVETGDLGEVRLDFESAFRVLLKESTLVTLERIEDQKGFHVVLIVKRGSIQVENLGHEGDLFIAKNGERISANQYHESPLSKVAVENPQTALATTTASVAGATLSEQEIQDVMGSHRTSFLKCYSQLLQKDPNAKGDATLTFTVENNGKVNGVEITSNTLKQDDFKKCLSEVMNRVEFRSFQGPPVSSLFPLKFE
jgi:hypothetical protein